jgi:hypothetical protein
MISALPPVSRRAFLAGGLTAAVAAACGGSGSGSETPARFFQAGFADGLRAPAFLVAGREQLAPVFLADETGRPLRPDETPENLAVRILRDGAVVDSQILPARSRGIFVPHYSPLIAVDEPGTYEAQAEIDGQFVGFEFLVAGAGTVPYLGVGDPLIATPTATTDNPLGVEPLCTYLPDPCPFHATSVDVAIASGRPVVLLIATPAFCQTTICGPVVEMMIERLATRRDIAAVHAEVWKNEQVVLTPNGTTDVVQTYQLGHEPALWVAEPGGIVRARLDFAWDLDEFDEALASAGI